MYLKTFFLLVSLIWCVHTQELKHESVPVFLLELKHVIIDSYHGAMNAKTLELFRNVEILDLRNCNFTTFNEDFTHPLKNLQKLRASNSHFDRVKSDISICCKKLLEIDVSDSKIGPLAEVEFKKYADMKLLETLIFHKMEIPVLYANALSGSHLKKVEIRQSDLATVEDGAFNGMDKLESLDLQDNKLKTIPTASLAAVTTLKELNLKGNLLEKVTAADFPSMPHLEKLSLANNPIKEIDLKGLKEKMPNIKKVDVSGVNIDLSKAEGVPLFKMQIA